MPGGFVPSWIGRVAVVVLALLAVGAACGAPADAAVMWHPKPALLPTPWTKLVGPDNALPDYPRPQMARSAWLNLNGVWGYMGRSAQPILPAPPPPAAYREQILVPYPAESALSGIARHDDEMWYRKVFKLPADWRGRHVLLHFGAVDQIATVWVNGQQVAHHAGGYTEFSADISKALRGSGSQVITVQVQDRNEANGFPVGKQRNNPAGIFYTGASGIWQTVWLEPVRSAHVDELDITPDLAGLTVTPRVSGTTDERTVVVAAEPGGPVVATGSGRAGETIRLQITKPHLWTPDDPYLYDLTVAVVSRTGKVLDAVTSYSGLRTIGTVPDSQGRPRIALNGRITFLHGPLDQGYWPDGVYTAPTDDALKSDLQRIKELGMNFVRKHGKVEAGPLVLLGGQARATGVAGHAVAERFPRHPGRPCAATASGCQGELRTRTARDGRPAAQRDLDHRLGAVQRGLGRVRRRPNSQRGQGRRPDAVGGRQQRGELLQVPWRHRSRRHLRRPHLRRARPAGTPAGPPGASRR